MKSVVIDITCFIYSDFMSGIQRVVFEVMKRLQGNIEGQSFIYLRYDSKLKKYFDISSNITQYLKSEIDKKKIGYCGFEFSLYDLNPGDIWFEIDQVWPHICQRRSKLYPFLKKQNVKIISFVQDILPVTHPQFFPLSESYIFCSYIGAVFKYSDAIIVTTEVTKKSVLEIMDNLNVPQKSILVQALGSDFENNKKENDIVSTRDLEIIKKLGDYVLMLGTIEPRKNHKVVLQAYLENLFSKGYSLVFAGRYGWEKNEVVEYTKKLNKSEALFHFFESPSNAAVEELYKHAKLIAFPSHIEGYGLPIVEALKCGVPVCAADVQVSREVGQDYCEYCSENDSKDWAEKIEELYLNKNYYNNLKQKIRTYKPLLWTDVALNFIKIFKNY